MRGEGQGLSHLDGLDHEAADVFAVSLEVLLEGRDVVEGHEVEAGHPGAEAAVLLVGDRRRQRRAAAMIGTEVLKSEEWVHRECSTSSFWGRATKRTTPFRMEEIADQFPRGKSCAFTEEGSVEEEMAARVLPQKFSSAKTILAWSSLIPLTV